MMTLYQFKHGLAALFAQECCYIIIRACYEIKLTLKINAKIEDVGLTED